MSLFRIAFRSILQRGVASLLTVLSMALGVMLVVAVLSIHGVVSQSFRNNASLGYNLIVGPKGGKEQLVLNSVYYLSQPIENIPYTYYLEFLSAEERERLQGESFAMRGLESLLAGEELLSLTEGGGWAGLVRAPALTSAGVSLVPDMTIKNHPPVEAARRHGMYGQMTQLAIPLCLGDYYGGFRVVGTTPALFNDLVYDIENDRKFAFAHGRNFEWRSKEHGYFEAVVGSRVARAIMLNEIHMALGANAAAALPLVSRHANWSRIENRNGTLVLAFDPGASERDLLGRLNRLHTEVLDGLAELPPEEEKALFALLAPQAITRKATRHLAVGDAISPRHGDPEGHVHARKFTVVGILAPSGTPNDRAVFVNMEGFYLMEDHAKPVEKVKSEVDEAVQPKNRAEYEAQLKAQQIAERKKQIELERAADPDPLPTEQREVTAILVKVDPLVAIGMENGINGSTLAQAALPVAVIYGLFEFFVTPLQWALLLLTGMICVVSAISILVSIYNSMSERRGEIAVMRALGAGRGTVMTIILLEATLLALAGGVLGWLAGHTGVLAVSPWIEEHTGVEIGFYEGEPSVPLWEPAIRALTTLGISRSAAEGFRIPVELAVIPALILLAVAVGIWPAISAYRTDVAKSLGK
jgi:ABC-type antimicrobial peptide transport system permease subunit